MIKPDQNYKSVLVTGGSGFIGSNLCKRLLEKNFKVLAVDNFITSNKTNASQLKQYSNFTFVKHDITKPLPDLKKYGFSTFDFIYHLACPTGVPNLLPLSQEMLLTCSIGTKNILDLANRYNSTFLFTSSSEVYGNPEKFPQTEEYTGNVDPLGLRSSYEEGKRFSESLIISYVRKFGLDAKIVRVFNTYGPGMSGDESRVIPRFIMQATSGMPVTVQGNGAQTRTFCYVDDLVNGLILVMNKGKKGRVYNLGGTKEYKIKNIAEVVLKLSGSKSKIKYVKRPTHDHAGRRPDISKIKKLGWNPKVSLNEGILKTIESINAKL